MRFKSWLDNRKDCRISLPNISVMEWIPEADIYQCTAIQSDFPGNV